MKPASLVTGRIILEMCLFGACLLGLQPGLLGAAITNLTISSEPAVRQIDFFGPGHAGEWVEAGKITTNERASVVGGRPASNPGWFVRVRDGNQKTVFDKSGGVPPADSVDSALCAFPVESGGWLMARREGFRTLKDGSSDSNQAGCQLTVEHWNPDLSVASSMSYKFEIPHNIIYRSAPGFPKGILFCGGRARTDVVLAEGLRIQKQAPFAAILSTDSDGLKRILTLDNVYGAFVRGLVTEDGGLIAVGSGEDIKALNADRPGNNGPTSRPKGIVAKWDSSGRLLWQKRLESTTFSSFGHVVEAKDGGYVVAGLFMGKLDIGKYNIENQDNSAAGFLVKISSDGIVEWLAASDGKGLSFQGLCAMPGGRLLALVGTTGSAKPPKLGGVPFKAYAERGLLLALLDPNGGVLATYRLLGKDFEPVSTAQFLAVSAKTGEAAVSLRMSGLLDFGQGAEVSSKRFKDDHNLLLKVTVTD